jgi:hypothetical protein
MAAEAALFQSGSGSGGPLPTENPQEEQQDDERAELDSTVSEDAFAKGFRDQRVLYQTRWWDEAFARGASTEELRAELRREFWIDQALVSKPAGWTTELGQILVNLLVLWAAGRGDELGQELLDLLFRVSLSLRGAGANEIEKAMATLRAQKLPKRFAAAVAAANVDKSVGHRGRGGPPTTHGDRGNRGRGQQNRGRGTQRGAH